MLPNPATQTTSGDALPQFPPGTMYVTFRKMVQDKWIPMGWLAFDGNRYTWDFPGVENPDFGNELLMEPIHRPKHHPDITSETPEAWLSGLHLMFSNAYSQVSGLKIA